MSAKCPWCEEPLVTGKRYYECGTSSDADATEKDRDFACFLISERNAERKSRELESKARESWQNAARALHALIPQATSWREPANVQAALELYRKAKESSQ